MQKKMPMKNDLSDTPTVLLEPGSWARAGLGSAGSFADLQVSGSSSQTSMGVRFHLIIKPSFPKDLAAHVTS